ncbi:MAG: hypothetical protein IJ764_07670 [Bacteroidales bacterium]|nr:hypothetical protein [Bacteroidales bacterium]
MKRYSIAIFLSAIMLISCHRQGAEIENVALGYATAVGNYDFDAASPYVTEETRAVTLTIFKRILTMTDTAYIRSNTPAEIKIKNVTLTSDSTARVVYHKSTPITEQNDTLHLVHQQNRWLVDNVIELNPFMKMILATAEQ